MAAMGLEESLVGFLEGKTLASNMIFKPKYDYCFDNHFRKLVDSTGFQGFELKELETKQGLLNGNSADYIIISSYSIILYKEDVEMLDRHEFNFLSYSNTNHTFPKGCLFEAHYKTCQRIKTSGISQLQGVKTNR